eukprot:scaffold65441_cov66-Phaeocystis_antarctica.AAC.7
MGERVPHVTQPGGRHRPRGGDAAVGEHKPYAGCCRRYYTAYFLLANYLLLAATCCYLLLTAHYSPVTAHYSLPATYYSIRPLAHGRDQPQPLRLDATHGHRHQRHPRLRLSAAGRDAAAPLTRRPRPWRHRHYPPRARRWLRSQRTAAGAADRHFADDHLAYALLTSQVPLTDISLMIIFIVVGIGVDDVIVVVACLDRQK